MRFLSLYAYAILISGLTQNYRKTNRKGHEVHVRATSRREVKRVLESPCVSPKYNTSSI